MSLRPVTNAPPARWSALAAHAPRPPAATASPSSFSDPVEQSPRARARDASFGHPTHGSAAAERFLDRLEAESGRQRRGAADYLSQPMADLVQTYAGLLRSGDAAAAAEHRRSATAAFAARPLEERLRLDTWMDHAATFCRHAADLLARVLKKADANLEPFAQAAVQAQVAQGLNMLRLDNVLPPTLTPVDAVLQQARAAREARIAAIDAFYEAALTGSSIAGLPPRKQDTTFWLRDGRLIFNNLDDALSMAPRAIWVRKYTGPTPISVIQYGPGHFHGKRPVSIEYHDAGFKPGFLKFADEVYAPIDFDPDPDGITAQDSYRLRNGGWREFGVATTPEIEMRKARWFARLQSAAAQAVG